MYRLTALIIFLGLIAGIASGQGFNRNSGGVSTGKNAPDFELKLLNSTRTVKLSSFKGEKPVVLVFGSFT